VIGPTSTLVEGEQASGSGDGQVVIEDFSDIESGWMRIITNEGGADYGNGGYQIFIQKSNHTLWVTSGNNFTNVRVEVDAVLLAGGEDNNFGVICRYQNDENFYALVISSDGYFSIRKRYQGGALETIIGDSFQFSEKIKLGKKNNLIAAECVGSQIKLFVNGEKIAETTDGDIPFGDVGIIAGTFSATSAEILFDNFKAFEIE
jgi:hypothetical protein